MGLHERQRQIDLSYLKQAYILAMKSPDKSTQNGAVIVKDNSFFSLDNILASGINEFPLGVIYSEERLNRPLKYIFTEHAERKAIYDAAKKGVGLDSAIMYVPWFACADCGRAIIESGIKEVIGFSGPEKWTREQVNGGIDWEKSIGYSLNMFDEAKVKHRIVDGNIGGISVLFSGKIVCP